LENRAESEPVESELVTVTKLYEEAPRFVIQQQEDAVECPYCLCRPCITNDNNRQMWWETEQQPARAENSGTRKRLYKYFWTMLYHRLVWEDPRYIARKQAALGQDPRQQQLAWSGTRFIHERDLMPECVLKLVRWWLPNPAKVPYMGHKWM
jgi:hypothetical protein